MEYAKDEVFKITYNTSVSRLKNKDEKWTSKVWHKIKKHKFISVIVLLFFMFSCINFLLIQYFITIMGNVNFI